LSALELSSSLNILGLVRGEERFFNLTGSSQFEAGDILIVLGPRQELNRLGNILAA
jgi:Trk K+ transport system NAD-binding subunit